MSLRRYSGAPDGPASAPTHASPAASAASASNSNTAVGQRRSRASAVAMDPCPANRERTIATSR